MKFFVGCSGWRSQDWANNFYPKGLDPSHYLSYYSKVFNMVHVNFGKISYPPKKSTLENWANETPDDFRFTIKIPQNIVDTSATRYLIQTRNSFSKSIQDIRISLGEFLESLSMIEEKTLAVLLSPPSGLTLQNNGRAWLEEILTKCTYHGYSAVIDFGKNSSWYQELTYNILRKHKACFAWSNVGHQYYYPAITSNFVFLNLSGAYINKNTAIKYIDLIKNKSLENGRYGKKREHPASKKSQNFANYLEEDALDFVMIVSQSPSVVQMLQKLLQTEELDTNTTSPTKSLLDQSKIWPGRVIMHIDMNAFFPACEELRDPSLKGKAHAVIMTPEKETDGITRGAVASCSYEARKYGVRSAMSLSRALELCPNLILKPVDKEYYNLISQQVMRLLEEYADVLEQTSIDEAYIDCTKKITMQQSRHPLEPVPDTKKYSTENQLSQDPSHRPSSPPEDGFSSHDNPAVKDYALKIKYSIREQCGGLACSIGVATNKSTSKIASDFQKPDGLTIVYPQDTKNFLAKLNVDQISGIGVKTTKSLKDMGVQIIGDLANADIQRLLERFGKKQGLWMWQIANGKENDMVVPRGENISLSTEETLLEPVRDKDEILKILLSKMTDDIYNRVTRRGYEFKTIGIKLVRSNFTIETRETTYSSYQKSKTSIASVLEILLDRFNFEDYHGEDPKTTDTPSPSDLSEQKDQVPRIKKVYPVYIRKLGIKVSNLSRIDSKAKKAQRSILDFV